MNAPDYPTALRPPSRLMHPRMLSALPVNAMSAARSFLSRMTRERWDIALVEADIDADGNGTLGYEIRTPNAVLSLVSFSTQPSMVNRTQRIIGSSWDVQGALFIGALSAHRIQETKRELPKLYAGRAADDTLIWFRANRSVRLFETVADALANGAQPSPADLAETGYLLRNTGLDGNGTFGTVDFEDYDSMLPVTAPFHAQMLAAYMMREIAFDLAEKMAAARNGDAVPLRQDLKQSLAIGNGSALGLAMFVMNRPKLISKWISLYEESTASALRHQHRSDSAALDHLEILLEREIGEKAADLTPSTVFPGAKLIAVELAQVLRTFRDLRRRERSVRLSDIYRAAEPGLLPESLEIFRSLALELVREEWEGRLDELRVDESMPVDPFPSVGSLREALETDFGWVLDFALNIPDRRNRVWYKSRSSEEPRSGPLAEVPDGTIDISTNAVVELVGLHSLLVSQPSSRSVGDFVAAHPEQYRAVAIVQNLAAYPYSLARVDYRDDDLVPVHLVHLPNVFCFGLERTEDVHRRALRGRLFADAPTRDQVRRGEVATTWQGRLSDEGKVTA